MVTQEQKDALVRAACEVRGNAYAPYSNYLVGAALLADNGQIYTGINVENASYGLTICAERTAVFKMVSEGHRQIMAIAICTRKKTGSGGSGPCGACRQVLIEFAGDIPVLTCDPEGNVQETTLHTLLPQHFGRQHLQ